MWYFSIDFTILLLQIQINGMLTKRIFSWLVPEIEIDIDIDIDMIREER